MLLIESGHLTVFLFGLNHYLCLSFSAGDHLSMAKEAHWWDEQPLEGNLGNFFLQPHYKNECHSSGYMCSSLMSIAPVAGYWSEIHSFVSFVKGSNLKCTVHVWGFSFGLNISCSNQLLDCFSLRYCLKITNYTYNLAIIWQPGCERKLVWVFSWKQMRFMFN